MVEIALKLENIRKTYGTTIKTEVLHGINLSIEAKSFVSIVGQSGSGKSTLLNIIGTLDRPSEGKVEIFGKDVASLKKRDLAKLRNTSIGFVFQHHYLLPEFTAYENIVMPYRITHRQLPKSVQEHANDLIKFVGLEAVKDNLANEMSGGQQQRTAIARALINRPKIILADEPTGALDTDSTEQVYKLLRDINRRFGTTFIVITHDKKVAERTDRMIEIRDGAITLDLEMH